MPGSYTIMIVVMVARCTPSLYPLWAMTRGKTSVREDVHVREFFLKHIFKPLRFYTYVPMLLPPRRTKRPCGNTICFPRSCVIRYGCWKNWPWKQTAFSDAKNIGEPKNHTYVLVSKQYGLSYMRLRFCNKAQERVVGLF